ncbi:hypothetical protein P7K49_040235 [Saguinus oedipus]|uniref:Uncharacterized protein n=1 Tax=Saguinus oedipus TaxID=9490 RepID=A0ABQ9T8S8_SAGOE|nr:hypothetical protein P7K49_040235 [Saguinus oedipus]
MVKPLLTQPRRAGHTQLLAGGKAKPKGLGMKGARNLRRLMAGGPASSLYREQQIPSARPCSQAGPLVTIPAKDKLESSSKCWARGTKESSTAQ